MLLIDKLKKNRITAMKEKNRNVSTLLGTVIGECETLTKNTKAGVTTDKLVQGVLRSFIKNLNKTYAVITEQFSPESDNAELVEKYLEKGFKIDRERQILESYLPQMLTDNQLADKIQEYIHGGSENLGLIMKRLKADCTNQYDGKTASLITRQILDSRENEEVWFCCDQMREYQFSEGNTKLPAKSFTCPFCEYKFKRVL